MSKSLQTTQVDRSRLANLRYIEEHGADFFVTGDSQAMFAFDFDYIPYKGVNLSSANQSLQQGYQIAKYAFEHVKSGTIKFVFIGLSLYSAFYKNDAEDFNIRTGQVTTPKDVDLSCERAKEDFRQEFSENTLKKLAHDGLLSDSELKENSKLLGDHAKLCSDNGAKPIFVTFPVESTLKKIYNANLLKLFRETVNSLNKSYKSVFIDLLDSKLATECFYGKSRLNPEGAAAATALLCSQLCFNDVISIKKICGMDADYFNVLSRYYTDGYKKLIHYIFCRTAVDDFNRLSKTLPADECKNLMAHAFSGMTYNHLAILSDMLPPNDYNDLAERVFEISAEKIRHKKKIKVGFCFENPSKWCGDELYNLFARDKRFEPTVFYFPKDDGLTRLEFAMSLDRFRSRGLNIFEVQKSNVKLPEQDILIQMCPYNGVPQSFRLINLKLSTLLTHITYSYSVSYRPDLYDSLFSRVLWKRFFSSTVEQGLYQKTCIAGVSRGFYSGYPRMDIFFDKKAVFKFDWKMVRPDAKKIIWAPHHNVKDGGGATFQWNYQFMYEFAKSHPETSWVVKPHPFLLSRAVSNKVFPSAVACKEYFQKWNELPNAQVYMGSYYQDIFATSDGMIHDSGSFVAEYQYVDKPMIYLRFKMGGFSDLGKEILKASYCVDGRDFDAIAAMMKRVFIEGDDYKAAERRAIFEKYLNYPKTNGMLASEFIYQNIVDELKEPTT